MPAGEDAEIKQLLWVIENLQEELHLSSAAMEQVESSVRDCQAVVSQLQVRLLSACSPAVGFHTGAGRSREARCFRVCVSCGQRAASVCLRRALLCPQEEYQAGKAAELELQEELRVLHSKLEAQLLAKLDQEEELRWETEGLWEPEGQVCPELRTVYCSFFDWSCLPRRSIVIV